MFNCRYSGVQPRKVPSARHLVDVKKFEAFIYQQPDHVIEDVDAVQIFHPPFKALCRLRVKACNYQELDFSVGFVQLVLSRKCKLEYNIGAAYWEFSGLTNDKMIVDSDGQQLPFYGSEREVQRLSGTVVSDREVCISMVDQPSLKCSWSLDLWACQPSRKSLVSKLSPLLKEITRDQTFLTSVLLLDHVTGDMEVLASVEWGLKLAGLVDVTRKVGRRVTLLRRRGNLVVQPKKTNSAKRKRQLVKSLKDDKCMTVTANDSDMLIWRHKHCLNPVTIVQSRICYDSLQSDCRKSCMCRQRMKDKKMPSRGKCK